MTDGLLKAMDDLERHFAEWAAGREDIRAAVVVGSRARADHPADEWADLDVGFTTTNPKAYHTDRGWISEIAGVWACYRDPSGVTYHVLFEGGLDAGIAVLPDRPIRLATRILPALQRLPGGLRGLPFGLGRRIEREIASGSEYYGPGVRVLLDKDGTATRFLELMPANAAVIRPPSRAKLDEARNEFMFLAVWTAKHIWRGELWRARAVGLEGRMRDLLIQMVEWHAAAASGPIPGWWSGGRFLEEWAEAGVLAELQEAFAGYDAAEMAEALRAQIELFTRLSAETAAKLGFAIVPPDVSSVLAWINAHGPAS